MKYENCETIRERLLLLIAAEYESDAAFERACGLAEKTVNNWRRGRSASFMKMLPLLAEKFHMPVSEFLDLPLGKSGSELSDEEWKLLRLYRKTRTLPKERRAALAATLESVITLYLSDGTARKKD